MENLTVIGKWLRGFSRFTSDCAIGHLRTPSETLSDQKDDIVHSCSQMVHQLHGAYEPLKVCSITCFQSVFLFSSCSSSSTNPQSCGFLLQIKVRIKALSGLARGMVATEAKKVQSNWVILDK